MFFVDPSVLYRLAVEACRAGRWAEAGQVCRQILQHDTRHADALHLLGAIALQTRRPDEALPHLQQAVAVNPASAAFQCSLGLALVALGRAREAAEACRTAIRLDARMARAWSQLGAALHEMGEADSAIAACEEAIRLQPAEVKAQKRLSVLHFEKRRYGEAIEAGRRAVALNACDPNAWFNLANARWAGGEMDEAMSAYCQAVTLKPDYAAAWMNLAGTLEAARRWGEAERAYRQAIKSEPDLAVAHNNLGNLLGRHGQMDEALACHRRAVEIDPGRGDFYSNLLVHLHYSPRYSAKEIRAAHEEYDRRFGAPRRQFWIQRGAARAAGERLRIGFVSPHFAEHPVGRFLVRLLERLPTEEFGIFCYSDTATPDAMTARLQRAAGHWRETRRAGEEELDATIRRDGIDILFDLAGHTAGGRLPVFARKPAPIQITWLDYVGTTGLAAMDYLLADPRQVPPGAEVHYCEKILRLPDDYICFDPPAEAPEPGPLPALARGGVTFGNLSALSKVTPEMLSRWAEILERVPNSRLLLKNTGFEDPAVQARLRAHFPGIAPERLELRGWSSASETLATYREVDVALDTFPYNGGLTVCEALWMGVPVVTCAGETFASRHGLAHLTAAGFTETVATDLRHYVELAVSWAEDLPRLAATRAELRTRVARSPLLDGERFARNFAEMLREVCQRGT